MNLLYCVYFLKLRIRSNTQFMLSAVGSDDLLVVDLQA